MGNVLFVTSSLNGEKSKSREVALDFLNAWLGARPGAGVTMRDTNAIPHLSGEAMQALMSPAEARTKGQQQRVALADQLIAEVEAADTIIIAAPMYNFTISSPLKAWIDHIARAGRTFRYTASGPEGQLKGKKVFVIASRGGLYSEGPGKAMDFQEPYLRAMLGFLGLTDVTFLHVEGQGISAEAAAHGVHRARKGIAELMPFERVAA
ncbi:MAG TPA: NAD(P)H-dependent oxidoreductase [Micropepsaceae bacterium]|nr:NAD(P)H-dependent oxidoreductase [Micropepsaceae bacterium]